MKNKYIALTALFVIFSVSVIFTYLLTTAYYGYFLYILLGGVVYVLSKTFGKEIYLLLLVPILVVASSLLGAWFILNYYNFNGLNPLKLHPFTLAWLVIYTLEWAEVLLKGEVRLDRIVKLGFLIIFILAGATFWKRGMNGIPILIENYIGPITFFLFFYSQKSVDVNKVKKVAKLFIGIAVILGVMGIVEFLNKASPLEQLYINESADWFNSTFQGGYRIKTIVGHPLCNAVFFLSIMVLVQVEVQSKGLKYFLLIFFSVVILLTGSRSIFALSFLILLYNKDLLTSRENKAEVMVPFIIVAVVLLIALNTPLGSTFLSRMDSGNASTEARVVLINYFTKNLVGFTIRGLGGSSDSIHLFTSDNMPILLENPWILLYFDISYLVLIYIVFLLAIILKIRYKYLLAIFIITISSFNSFGVKGSINYTFFFLLTYTYFVTPGFKPAFGEPAPKKNKQLTKMGHKNALKKEMEESV